MYPPAVGNSQDSQKLGARTGSHASSAVWLSPEASEAHLLLGSPGQDTPGALKLKHPSRAHSGGTQVPGGQEQAVTSGPVQSKRC